MSALMERFLKEAPAELQWKFACDCADRAVRGYAPLALGQAGLSEEAATLEQLPVLRDNATVAEAKAAVRRVYGDIRDSDTAQFVVVYAVQNALNATDMNALTGANAARVAYWVYGQSDDAEGKEWKTQENWIRRHWGGGSRVNADTLAALDAYIANGLLLGDDE